MKSTKTAKAAKEEGDKRLRHHDFLNDTCDSLFL